jgi:hypothetical protein
MHVVEDTLENVKFPKLNLFGVDLVENLHENEHLEDISKVECLLGWGA